MLNKIWFVKGIGSKQGARRAIGGHAIGWLDRLGCLPKTHPVPPTSFARTARKETAGYSATTRSAGPTAGDKSPRATGCCVEGASTCMPGGELAGGNISRAGLPAPGRAMSTSAL